MSEMIKAEPALAERLVRRLQTHDAVASMASLVGEMAAGKRPIFATGLGTSEHAAMGIAALLNDALDLPRGSQVQAIAALDVVRRPPPTGLVIGVTHEGGTPVTNEALAAARAAGARTAIVSVSDRSPAAALAELIVATEEQDQSWCHTVGYLSPLLVGTVV
ncbi:MAG: hypothetical protein M3Y29_06720, partial [Chloroflexota bacterium]|nr:hypothetical protein [Chloroflexota bacterium]